MAGVLVIGHPPSLSRPANAKAGLRAPARRVTATPSRSRAARPASRRLAAAYVLLCTLRQRVVTGQSAHETRGVAHRARQFRATPAPHAAASRNGWLERQPAARGPLDVTRRAELNGRPPSSTCAALPTPAPLEVRPVDERSCVECASGAKKRRATGTDIAVQGGIDVLEPWRQDLPYSRT